MLAVVAMSCLHCLGGEEDAESVIAVEEQGVLLRSATQLQQHCDNILCEFLYARTFARVCTQLHFPANF